MDGWATAAVPDGPSAEIGAVQSRSLTQELGCTETAVACHRLGPSATLAFPAGRERLLVPVSGRATVEEAVLGGGRSVARLPGSREMTIQSAEGVRMIEIAVDRTTTGDPQLSTLDDWRFEIPTTSDVRTAHLTAPLGCEGMKVNVRELRGGQAVPGHTEGTQEELFVPLAEPARMVIDGETIDTPVGTVTRVAPATVRSASNPGSGAVHWVMVGAPPTGTPSGWDPGAEIIE